MGAGLTRATPHIYMKMWGSSSVLADQRVEKAATLSSFLGGECCDDLVQPFMKTSRSPEEFPLLY